MGMPGIPSIQISVPGAPCFDRTPPVGDRRSRHTPSSHAGIDGVFFSALLAGHHGSRWWLPVNDSGPRLVDLRTHGFRFATGRARCGGCPAEHCHDPDRRRHCRSFRQKTHPARDVFCYRNAAAVAGWFGSDWTDCRMACADDHRIDRTGYRVELARPGIGFTRTCAPCSHDECGSDDCRDMAGHAHADAGHWRCVAGLDRYLVTFSAGGTWLSRHVRRGGNPAHTGHRQVGGISPWNNCARDCG